MKYDVCALGELLIDFTDSGESDRGNPLMEANPGGAPGNLLAMLQKMGCSTVFIGKVGDDIFGRQLRSALKDAGISDAGLAVDPIVPTTLAFVHNEKNGERFFSFYRNPGADVMLSEADVLPELIFGSRIFHFGSLSMTHPMCEAATKKAIALAEEAGLWRSFDPNLREALWDSPDMAKEKIAFGLAHCDILKISDNELQWFTGEEDPAIAMKKLRSAYSIPLVFLTMGGKGSMAYAGDTSVFCPAFPAHAIETTGAGDTFFGCVLGQLLRLNRLDPEREILEKILRTAGVAASLIVERKGALKVMPTLEEIRERLGSK